MEKKENLIWNETVAVMDKSGVVESNGIKCRIKDDRLERFIDNTWCKSLNLDLNMGRMTYKIVEEKKDSLSEKMIYINSFLPHVKFAKESDIKESNKRIKEKIDKKSYYDGRSIVISKSDAINIIDERDGR